MKKIRRKKAEKKPRYQGNQSFPTYRPNIMTEKDMDEGLKELFSGQKRRQSQSYPRPRANKPQQSIYRPPQRQVEEEYEEEAYWSGEEWEEWALALYDTYPDLRPYLPEWFLEAVEE